MRLSLDGKLNSHIGEIEIHAAIIKNAEESVDDILILLNSMPAEFGVVVEALKIIDDLTFGKAKQRLLEFDSRLDKQSSSEKILAAKFERTCFFCKKPGHIKKDCQKFKLWLEAKTES